VFKCLNCGFKFVNPGWRYRESQSPILAIDPRALRVPCCPKCRSDAIKEISDEN